MGYLKFLLVAASLTFNSVQAEPLVAVPAVLSTHAVKTTVMGATWANKRLVAVGDHGIVLLSDDQGRQYRQSSAVPISTVLTSVSFIDANRGWAVGHWGAILATRDAGDTWQVQRLSSEEDRPLFAVHFFNAHDGVAVGLWSRVLVTDDGGKVWTQQSPGPMSGESHADLNLMSLFADAHDGLYATAERGQVLRSDDRGKTWRYLDTGYEGTLWSGAVLADGSLLVGGQRGTLIHGSADGQTWRQIPLNAKSSITSIAVSGQHVIAVGLDGLVVRSNDGGSTFHEQITSERISLTAALINEHHVPVLFSRRGVVPPLDQ